MSVSDIEAKFFEIIERFELGCVRSDEFISAIVELSDRQWHTYTLLEESLKGRVEKALFKIWDSSNLDIVESALSVVASLGLVGLYVYIYSLDFKFDAAGYCGRSERRYI